MFILYCGLYLSNTVWYLQKIYNINLHIFFKLYCRLLSVQRQKFVLFEQIVYLPIEYGNCCWSIDLRVTVLWTLICCWRGTGLEHVFHFHSWRTAKFPIWVKCRHLTLHYWSKYFSFLMSCILTLISSLSQFAFVRREVMLPLSTKANANCAR